MNTFQNHILYLCRSEVMELCQQLDSVAIIRDVFKMHASAQTTLPDEAYLGWVNQYGEAARSLNMPSYIGGAIRRAGTKIINGNIHNAHRGLPRASGVTLLFDDITARVCCIMEAAFISSLRTASVSVLAVEELLDKTMVEQISVIGAGVLAQAHIELFLQRFPRLQTIHLFDLDTNRIIALRDTLTAVLQAHDAELHVTPTAEAAVRASQVVIPVTTTTVGYIQFSWLQPGTVLVHVSLDDVLPEVILRADRLIVDDWKLVKSDQRRILGRMYHEGVIREPDEPASDPSDTRRQIDAQLGDMLLGTRPGRSHAHDIILVNPFGLSIEDIALASAVYERARQTGTGLFLDC